MIAVIVAFAGAVTLAAVAGASRTATSFDRFLDTTRTNHVLVFAEDVGPDDVEELRALPGVQGVGYARQLAMIRPDGEFLAVGGSLDDGLFTDVDRPFLVAGRSADPGAPDEVVVGESLATAEGLAPGDVVPVRSYSQEQVDTGDLQVPAGPELELKVVGIERSAIDLSLQGGEGGVLLLPKAFTEAHGDQIGNFSGESGAVLLVRLDDGNAGVDRFLDQLGDVMNGRTFDVDPSALTVGGIQESIDLLAVGVLVFGLIAGAAAVIALGLVVNRQVVLLSADQSVLRELGLAPRRRTLALAGPILLSILVGSVVAVLGAWALSPLMPFGVAGRAEPDPGSSFDAAALGLGIVVFGGVLAAIALVAAWGQVRRSTSGRARARAASSSRSLAALGFAPPTSIGIGMALRPGSGSTAVPVRSSLVGVAVAVLGVVAVVVFSASLDGLLDAPSAYGRTWDSRVISVTGEVPDHPCGEVVSPVSDLVGVDAVANVCSLSITLDGRAIGGVGMTSLRGSIQPTVLEGRAASSVDEVTLGTETLHALHKDVGDEVVAQSPVGSFAFRVVGRVVVPTNIDAQAIADGAVFTGDGLGRLYDPGNVSGGSAVFVRYESGADGREVAARIEQLGGLEVQRSQLPLEVQRLEQTDRLPVAMGVFLPILGTVAVGYLLVTSVQRRRRDFAILASLGFHRRQLMTTVAVQATTVACVGLLLGVVPGIAAGGWLWRAAAGHVGVVPHVEVPVLAILGVALAALVIANLVAAIPARTAGRTPAAEVLRTECGRAFCRLSGSVLRGVTDP